VPQIVPREIVDLSQLQGSVEPVLDVLDWLPLVGTHGVGKYVSRHRNGMESRQVDLAAAAEANVVGFGWSGVGQSAGDVLKMTVCSSRAERLSDTLTSLTIPCARSHPDYVEIVSEAAGTDKGAALIRADLTNRRQRSVRTLALGDNLNDIGMLQSADLSLTFDNAPGALRDAAHVVLDGSRPKALRRAAELLKSQG
jgi:hydroxymethylpyrimidine pyrophosphatase-like HAD family hydrolase